MMDRLLLYKIGKYFIIVVLFFAFIVMVDLRVWGWGLGFMVLMALVVAGWRLWKQREQFNLITKVGAEQLRIIIADRKKRKKEKRE